jgi:hypothetical protein
MFLFCFTWYCLIFRGFVTRLPRDLLFISSRYFYLSSWHCLFFTPMHPRSSQFQPPTLALRFLGAAMRRRLLDKERLVMGYAWQDDLMHTEMRHVTYTQRLIVAVATCTPTTASPTTGAARAARTIGGRARRAGHDDEGARFCGAILEVDCIGDAALYIE